MTGTWNHNIHYHGKLIEAVPHGCRRALDVGCGQGALARRLARRCAEVVAIDRYEPALNAARAASGAEPNIEFLLGDVLTWPFESGEFDYVAALASLHHLPLRETLCRFRSLLKPGGVLAIVGLYRMGTVSDYAFASVALPVSWAVRGLLGAPEAAAPLHDPAETFHEIRAACHSLMPGGTFRRRLFFRYSFLWRKPAG